MSKFKIKNINLLSNWNYNISLNTDCSICRCNLNENSIYINNNLDSNVVQSTCGHAFHYECINIWFSKSKTCPLCSTEWIYNNIIEK